MCALCHDTSLGLAVASVIFAVIGLLHVFRLFKHFKVTIGEFHVPMVASIIGAPVFLLLALWLWNLR